MRKLLIFTLFLLIPATALALMPPMDEDELKKESNMIVKGAVTDVACTGKITQKDCIKKIGYKATLKVNKVIKGKQADKLNLFFEKYEFDNNCMGSPDTIHLVGEEALYYLKCNEDNCHLTHYDGIAYDKTGTTSLPKCKQ